MDTHVCVLKSHFMMNTQVSRQRSCPGCPLSACAAGDGTQALHVPGQRSALGGAHLTVLMCPVQVPSLTRTTCVWAFTAALSAQPTTSLSTRPPSPAAQAAHLYLKEEPRLKKTAFALGLGWSRSLKKVWYSTQIFQKLLHSSLLPNRNSSVSW